MAQQNKQTTDKNSWAPERKNDPGSNPSEKKNPFNIYWLWEIIIAVLIGYSILSTQRTAGVEIKPTALDTVLSQGDIVTDENPKYPENIGKIGRAHV